MNRKQWLMLLIACLTWGSSAMAQDFVYKPKNPAFGGDTFNYNWLQSSAQAQNDFTTSSFNQQSSLDQFSESLQRQLLSTLSRELISDQFGSDGLEDGTYNFGNFQVDVSSTVSGVIVNILDLAAGEQTQIVIPYY